LSRLARGLSWGVYEMVEGRPEAELTREETVILEEWKVVIETQMHFNDMIMRMRTTMLSVVIAIFSAAGLAFGQYPNRFLQVGNFRIHVSGAIVLFGVAVLASIFVVDYFYYYRMLLGSVQRGYQIDEAFKERKIGSTHLFGMTTAIRDSVGKPGKSRWFVIAFYLVPFLLGIVSLGYIVWGINP